MMFELLSRTRYGQIGLDIGAESVKMLQLAAMRGKPFVAAAALRHLPEDATRSDADPQRRQRILVETVREMLTNGVFHGRSVVSCLRAEEIGIKTVRLPRMPDDELASAAVRECQGRFGFRGSADRIHCIKAGEVRPGTDVLNEVILIAVPDDVIGRHLDMLSKVRLISTHIDSEPTALFGAYERFLRRASDVPSVTVIVDIGLACTKVIIARGKAILMIKTIDIAGRKFNESVAEELNMSYSEAASLRRRILEIGHVGPTKTGASDPPPEMEGKVEWSVFDAIREQVEALGREISLCLRYCSVTFRGPRPRKITLTGGEACDRHLVESLNEYLDCECVVGQPLWGIDLGGVEMGGDRRGELAEWSVAAGLAIRGLYGEIGKNVTDSTSVTPTTANYPRNTTSDGQDSLAVLAHQVEFLPEHIRHQRRRRRRLMHQGYLLVVCVAVMGILTYVRAERVAQARSNLAGLENSRSNLQKQAATITSLERRMSDLLIKKQIDEELGGRTDCTVVLAELCRITPPNIVMFSLDIKTDELSAENSEQPSPPTVVGKNGQKDAAGIVRRARMVITGLAVNDTDVANFIGQLSASNLFEDVNKGYTKTIVFRGQSVRKFQASCYLAR